MVDRFVAHFVGPRRGEMVDRNWQDGWIVKDRIETSSRPLPASFLSRIYPSIDTLLATSIVEIRLSGRMYTLSNFFFFFLPFFLGVCAKFLKIVWSLTAFLFFFFCKMFFSSSISTSVQKSEGEIDYSSILERCYIVQDKRNCWYRSIKSPEGKEFSQFAGVIVTKRFHPISNSSISIESPIQARRYQNITRHGATTIVNNPHPPL